MYNVTKRTVRAVPAGAIALCLVFCLSLATEAAEVRLGFLQGGDYIVHRLLRKQFLDYLEPMLPESVRLITPAEGYGDGGWDRDSCRSEAARLVRQGRLDMIVAVGPWAARDLLDAGYTGPIVAMYQLDPIGEGLVGAAQKPVSRNLTVHIQPDKFLDDIRLLQSLTDVKRLGVLLFAQESEADRALDRFREIGDTLGIEIVTARGFDNKGTYAYAKAFASLPEVDAVYLGPLWGFQTTQLMPFLDEVARRGKPSIVFDGKPIVDRGALAGTGYFASIGEARFHAVKAAAIIAGAVPADLKVAYRSGLSPAVNLATARALNLPIPEEVRNDFVVVESPDADVTPMALREALSRAINVNPSQLAKQSAIEAAHRAAQRALAAYLPQAAVLGTASYFNDKAVGNSAFLRNDQYQASFVFQQEIFSLERLAEIRAARGLTDAARADEDISAVDLELAVNLSFLGLLQTAENLSIQREYRNLIEVNLELARARVLLEGADTLDVLRLEEDRYRATQAVIAARHLVHTAEVIFKALLNLPPETPVILDTLSFSNGAFWNREGRLFPRVRDDRALEQFRSELVARALADNPRLARQRLLLAVQDDRLDANTARYFPSLGFRTTLTFLDRYADDPLINDLSPTWTATGALTFPIFFGTDRIRERQQLRAEYHQLEYQRDQISLEIMAEVNAAINDLLAAGTSMNPAFQARRRTETGVQQAIDRYSAEKVGALDLLDMQERHLAAQLTLVDTRYRYYRALARLTRAVGWTSFESYRDFIEEFYLRLETAG